MIGNLLKAALSLGGMGLVFGLLLAFASKVFAVPVNEKEEAIASILPGANCGGCGFAGCGGYAKALADGSCTKLTACAAGGEKVARGIGEVLGVEVGPIQRQVAKVMCIGTTGVSDKKYEYKGISDCMAAVRLGGGERECFYSCLGLGTCVNSCRFDAIAIRDSVAYVDKEKCIGCGICASKCPKHIIEMVPYDCVYTVTCSSHDKGSEVRKFCRAGCIGCKLCEKACETGAIHVDDNCAYIDYDKCTGCGACAEKCPRKIIRKNGQEHFIVEGAELIREFE